MASHIFQRQIIEVTTEHTVDGFEFKEQLSEFCKRKLLPAIEKLFDSKASGHKVFQCGKLVIDVGELPLENWEILFVDHVIDELTKRISAAVPISLESSMHLEDEGNVFQKMNEDENVSRSILYFLEHGSLPWFSFIKSREALQRWMMKLLETSQFSDRLLKLIRINPNVVKRVIHQFDEQVLQAIVVRNGIGKDFILAIQDFWRPVFETIKYDESRQTRIIYKILLEFLQDLRPLTTLDGASLISRKIFIGFSNDQRSEIGPLLRNRVFEFRDESISIGDVLVSEDGVEKERSEKKEKISTKSDVKYWYVTNAGLVILHPFLSGLFNNVGYTEKNEWVNDKARYRGIALTQYLVTGEEEYPEFNIMLNKILTGYPLDESLPTKIFLSDFEKDEAIDLLKSVIHHWAALKNTSVDGLRSTFLMRDAKVSADENGWLLQVEQRTVDILMNKLPWGISIIKTPWMEKKVHVEWI